MTTIVTDFGILVIGSAMFYYAAQAFEMKMLGKWLFLTSLLFAAFEMVVQYVVSNPEVDYFFLLVMVIWFVMLAIDAVQFLPLIGKMLWKKFKR